MIEHAHRTSHIYRHILKCRSGHKHIQHDVDGAREVLWGNGSRLPIVLKQEQLPVADAVM